jgi:hypothetical protein
LLAVARTKENSRSISKIFPTVNLKDSLANRAPDPRLTNIQQTVCDELSTLGSEVGRSDLLNLTFF